ncbi:MAG: class I SAM-dependent methyltransferase [Gammaproteobacteria bacterium]
MPTMDREKLNRFMGQMLGDLGGAFSIGLVRVGHQLGLYRELNVKGPLSTVQLADATGCAERYVREWAAAQAASNYIDYDAGTQKFSMSPEQAAVFCDENSPVYMVPGFDTAAAYISNQEQLNEAFKSGAGVSWGDQASCLFCAVARFFHPGYKAKLVSEWLPALDGVVEKLERGATVADVGCGHGFSTILMAEAYPNSHFVGYDFHEDSIVQATKHAEEHGVGARCTFEIAGSDTYAGSDLDLVTCFDCLHDMGDPRGVAKHVFQSLKADGTWMVVEPYAEDNLEDNLHPIGRLFYSGSTMVCVPCSLSQDVGEALGAQAGEKKLSEVIASGGFSQIRRAAETRFHLVLEAKP